MAEFQFSKIETDKLLPAVRQCYGFRNTMQMRLLKYSENLTYQVWDEITAEEYVLRVFRSGYHQEDEMEGELLWIHQITQDTDIKTADVLPGEKGSFVCSIQVEGQELHCALFQFIQGDTLRGIYGCRRQKYMEKLGEITAKLHNQVIAWPQAKTLKRFTWDIDDLVGAGSRWGDFSLMKGLPEEYMDWYRQAVEIIRSRLERFGRSSDRYGLIHDDISINNVLLKGEELYLLDFDDCGFGWFLYDIPTMLLEYFDEHMSEALSAVLKGYETYRPLSQEELAELPTFILLKKIVRIGWIATRNDNDTVKQVHSDYYEKTTMLAKEYCEKYGEKNT